MGRAGRPGTGRPADRRPRGHRRVVAVPARRALRPLSAGRLRQPGEGRNAMPKGPVSAEVIADDAAALLRALDIASAHVAGFSMGGVIAQEPALRHSELVRSLVLQSTYALFRSQLNFWRWLPESSPSEHAFFEAFFTWVYTPRAHADGSVDQIIQEAMAFPYKQSLEGFQAQVDACLTHDTADRLSEITSPTLVLSTEFDIRLPPRLGRSVAAAIPNARFEVMPARRTSPSGGTRGMGRARRCILAEGWSTALKSATQQTNAEGAQGSRLTEAHADAATGLGSFTETVL